MKRLHRSLFSLLEKTDTFLALGHKFDSQGETVKSPGTSFSVLYLSGFLSGCLRLFASYKGGSQQFCIKTYPRNALLCYCAMLNCDFLKRRWLKNKAACWHSASSVTFQKEGLSLLCLWIVWPVLWRAGLPGKGETQPTEFAWICCWGAYPAHGGLHQSASRNRKCAENSWSRLLLKLERPSNHGGVGRGDLGLRVVLPALGLVRRRQRRAHPSQGDAVGAAGHATDG